MTSEAKFRLDLIELIKHWGGHVSAVESHYSSPGIPDLDYCLDGVEGHIELKFWGAKPPEIRPTQIAWMRDRVKAGGHPLMVMVRGPEIYICHGQSATFLGRKPRLEHWRKAAWAIIESLENPLLMDALRHPEQCGTMRGNLS